MSISRVTCRWESDFRISISLCRFSNSLLLSPLRLTVLIATSRLVSCVHRGLQLTAIEAKDGPRGSPCTRWRRSPCRGRSRSRTALPPRPLLVGPTRARSPLWRSCRSVVQALLRATYDSECQSFEVRWVISSSRWPCTSSGANGAIGDKAPSQPRIDGSARCLSESRLTVGQRKKLWWVYAG